MRLTWKEKLGSILNYEKEITLDEANELQRKSNQAILLGSLKTSDPFQLGYLPIIKARREELVGQICNINLKAKHEELAVRLSELDGITKLIDDIIEEGQKAQQKLELFNESRKETA